jgi:hypothetical protein
MEGATKFIEFDMIIGLDGSVVGDVTARETGANCNSIRKVMQKVGTITKDETTGPLCDPVTERTV